MSMASPTIEDLIKLARNWNESVRIESGVMIMRAPEAKRTSFRCKQVFEETMALVPPGEIAKALIELADLRNETRLAGF